MVGRCLTTHILVASVVGVSPSLRNRRKFGRSSRFDLTFAGTRPSADMATTYSTLSEAAIESALQMSRAAKVAERLSGAEPVHCVSMGVAIDMKEAWPFSGA